MHCNASLLAFTVLFLPISCALDLHAALDSTAREYDCAPIYALTPELNEESLKTSMACSTKEAFEYVCHIGHAGKIAHSPGDKKQKAATALPRDEIPKRDFAKPIAARVSRILETISRHLMAQIIPMICSAPRDPRPGLAVGTFRVLCHGMCTAKRVHADDEEQTCRVGCLDEPDSLTHYNKCTLFYTIVNTVWRSAAVLLRDHFPHQRFQSFTTS